MAAAGGSGRVQVAVRVRPFSPSDKGTGTVLAVTGESGQVVITDPVKHHQKPFTFDHCLCSCGDLLPSADGIVSQEQVFATLGPDVLDNAFAGYNASVFAYGQTGSGKTHTMMGSPGDAGLIPRLCQAMFERIQGNADANISYKVEVSFMEIYNEKVMDLLRPDKGKALRVRQHKALGPYVDGLAKLAVTSFDAISRLMNEGNQSRTTAQTKMNERSSRSHAVATLYLTTIQYDPATKQTGEKASRLCLVDLAGSERSKKSGATGQRLKEGSSINKSLSQLGLVISALAEGKAHIPYRDSVLTWLLKDTLGGNSRTVMIATVSPAEAQYGETLSTLRYANQAKNIVNKAVVNEDPNQKLIRELREELAALRGSVDRDDSTAQVQGLKQQLKQTEDLLAEMTTSWEEKLKATETVLAEKQQLLDQHAASVAGGDTGGLCVASELPHFVLLSDDPLHTKTVIYTFKEGRTAFGAELGACDIVLDAPDVMARHCEVRFEVTHNPELGRLEERVTIEPVSEATGVHVNDIRTTKRVRLAQSNIVRIGDSFCFRFNHPLEAKLLRKRRESGNLPSPMHRSNSPLHLTLMNASLSPFHREREARLQAEQHRLEKEKHQLEANRRALEQQSSGYIEVEAALEELAREKEKNEEALRRQLEEYKQRAEEERRRNEGLQEQLRQTQAAQTSAAAAVTPAATPHSDARPVMVSPEKWEPLEDAPTVSTPTIPPRAAEQTPAGGDGSPNLAAAAEEAEEEGVLSNRHISRVAADKGPTLICMACGRNNVPYYLEPSELEAHCKSDRHTRGLASRQKFPVYQERFHGIARVPASLQPAYHCTLCGFYVLNDKGCRSHLRGGKHARNLEELELLEVPPLPTLARPSSGQLAALDAAIEHLFTQVAASPAEAQVREQHRAAIQDCIRTAYPNGELHLFGSSLSGFGAKGSDMDMCLTVRPDPVAGPRKGRHCARGIRGGQKKARNKKQQQSQQPQQQQQPQRRQERGGGGKAPLEEATNALEDFTITVSVADSSRRIQETPGGGRGGGRSRGGGGGQKRRNRNQRQDAGKGGPTSKDGKQTVFDRLGSRTPELERAKQFGSRGGGGGGRRGRGGRGRGRGRGGGGRGGRGGHHHNQRHHVQT